MTQTKELSKESRQHLKQFIELARQCETGTEFYQEARKIEGIPHELSEWFELTYNGNSMLAPELASEGFLEDVDNGVYSGI